MLSDLRHIHPHARLWIVTAVILGLLFIFKEPVQKIEQIVKPPHGKVIAYYQNDYQLYAIERLTQLNMLEQYPCLYELWTKESNWNYKAKSKTSSARGIPQLLNLKTNDPYEQINLGLKYIKARHKTPCLAWTFFQSKNYY